MQKKKQHTKHYLISDVNNLLRNWRFNTRQWRSKTEIQDWEHWAPLRDELWTEEEMFICSAGDKIWCCIMRKKQPPDQMRRDWQFTDEGVKKMHAE